MLPRNTLLGALAAAFILIAPAATAAHQACEEEGKNMQCSEFGMIAMDNQRDIRGEPITVTTDLRIDESYADAGARFVMVSVRHDDPTGNSPISLDVKSFSGPDGNVFLTRTDHDVPNEVNLWVHVVDVPEGKPLKLEVEVHASDRGAFQLETLVMAFDRGYAPIKDSSGDDITLYASTLLGVNDATGSGGGGGPLSGVRTPGFTVPVALAALGALLIVARRKHA